MTPRIRTLLWLLLAALCLVALAVVGIPVGLVQPFAPQSPGGLAWSWTLRGAAPLVTALVLGPSLLLALVLWRSPVPSPAARMSAWRRWRRRGRRVGRAAAIAALVVPVAAATWFARQNHFEWMFRPFPDPQFVAVDRVTNVKPGEPVIGVTGSREALAFPITRIGYHHLVNTKLDGVPIVATY